MWNECAAILMARPDGPVEQLKRFPETFITQMSYIENQTEAFRLAEQIAPKGIETSGGIRAVSVNARAVVGRTNCAQTFGDSVFQMLKGQQGIGAFERKNVADG